MEVLAASDCFVPTLRSEYNSPMWTFFHKLGSPPWLYGIAGTILRWLLPIALIALGAGVVWGLLYTSPDFRQGNSYRIIYIHVPAAVVALAGYYVMAIAAAVSLIWKMKMADVAMLAAAPVGAVLTFIALVTGSIWGKPTWGTWWAWDARMTSMLILLFLYLGVMALYEAYDNKAVAARACAILALVGTVNIPIIYKSVDWWYSLHQPASIKFSGDSTIDASMLYPLILCIVSFYLLFTCALLANMRVEILRRERKTNWVQRLVGEGS
ncbi:MAG: heme exporter protein C [Congregibacter sp.]|jgi:heme exporter protein C